MRQAPATVTNLRAVIPTVYLPGTLFSIGQGAIAPVVVLSALELGASVGVAAVVAALPGIGHLIGDIPAGALAARIGERRAMLWATLLAAIALVGCVAASSVPLLAVALVALGIANSVWMLARHSYLTEAVPIHLRARAMSTLGGVQRIGVFIGPFIGAAAMQWWHTDGAYGVHIVAAVIAAATVAVVRDPQSTTPQTAAPSKTSTLQVLRRNLPILRTLGMGITVIGIVRSARNVVIPLWGAHIGLDPATISLVFGLAGAVDMLLFYPAGAIMDKFGRRAIAIPCLVIMGAALALMPLATSFTTLLLVSILLAFGNGIGSGIVMTLGADVAPKEGRAGFLGGWRLCGDLGVAAGPALVGGITAAVSLGPAVLAVAGISAAGAAMLARWIPART